jgi:hypothetical protein
MKGGGVGGSGSGGGGGSSGQRGGSGNKQKEQKKRNQQPPVEPTEAREKLASALERALAAGTASTPFLMNLFDQASTGALPASAASRKSLAEALSTPLKGKKLPADQAKAIAEPVSAAVNIDGLSPEDLSAKKAALTEALSAAELTDEQKAAVAAAFDKVTSDQQDEAIKRVADALDAIQAEGDASEEQKKNLAEALGALATGETKPDEASLTKLSDRLGKGLDKAQLLPKERAELAADFRVILNSAGVAMKDVQPTMSAVKSILKAGVVPQAEIQAVGNELTGIYQALNPKKSP